MKNVISILFVMLMSISLTFANTDNNEKNKNEKQEKVTEQTVTSQNDAIFEQMAKSNELALLTGTTGEKTTTTVLSLETTEAERGILCKVYEEGEVVASCFICNCRKLREGNQ